MKKTNPSKENKKTGSKAADGMAAASPDASASLRSLFSECLKDIYWAENALMKALPKLASNSTDPSLRSSISDHLSATESHIARLEKVFELLGEKAQGKKCAAMAGLIQEGDSILAETEPGPVRDAGIIAASQKVEHYEIASYGTLFSFAKVLGENEAAKLLQQTLAEEIEADKILTDIATASVNADADEAAR